jgi:hypothetical protein
MTRTNARPPRAEANTTNGPLNEDLATELPKMHIDQPMTPSAPTPARYEPSIGQSHDLVTDMTTVTTSPAMTVASPSLHVSLISPDGTLVTYLGSGVPESGEVDHCGPCRFLANVDGTDSRVIPGMHGNPPGTWSPDGTRIVATDGGYVGPPPVPEIIVVVDVMSREVTTVANGRAAIWIDDQTLLIQP